MHQATESPFLPVRECYWRPQRLPRLNEGKHRSLLAGTGSRPRRYLPLTHPFFNPWRPSGLHWISSSVRRDHLGCHMTLWAVASWLVCRTGATEFALGSLLGISAAHHLFASPSASYCHRSRTSQHALFEHDLTRIDSLLPVFFACPHAASTPCHAGSVPAAPPLALPVDVASPEQLDKNPPSNY